MDEAEALCTKISIMVNGELKCIGNLQIDPENRIT